MEQKFDGTVPKSELTLAGRKATRSEIVYDWGLQVRWLVRRDGQEVATAPARIETSYEHKDATPGKYEIVLQMFKYIDYKKTPTGEFMTSKFIDISNVVQYKI